MDLAPIGTDAADTEQRIIGRQRLHRRDHRLAVGSALERNHRLEVVRHRGVDAGMDHGGMAAAIAGGKGLRERAVGVARVPIPRLGQQQALRGMKTERIDVADID